jgi:hypothetical protein
MTRAVCPGSARIHCYIADEAARQQAEALKAHEAVAEDYAIGALLAWVGTLAIAGASALVRVFAEVQP